MFHVPEKYRIRRGNLASDASYGCNGAFVLPAIIGNRMLMIIASDGEGWEHVSVHVSQGKKNYMPTWDEMCYVKDTFWDDEDEVVQFHPRKSEYVNCHPHTLHLWRPNYLSMPTPPSILVGLRVLAGEASR